MRPLRPARKLVLVLLISLFAACKGSPTEPTSPPIGPLTGAWAGTVTVRGGGFLHPCPSRESITADIRDTADGQVLVSFSSTCYPSAIFKGVAATGTLTGDLSISQDTCREEGGFSAATGKSTGPFDSSHIHLETPELGTADCGFGSNTIDLDRSR